MNNTTLDASIKADSQSIRQSNFELLRIFSMLLIIAHHFALHSSFADLTAPMPFVNQLWILFLVYGGKVGVNLFVMITGYFGVCSRQLKVSKVCKLWLQIFTYSVAVTAAYCLFSGKFAWSRLGAFFAPVCTSNWWFVKVYFALFLLSPFLNLLLRQLSRRNYRVLLTLTVSLFCLLPSAVCLLFKTDVAVGNLTWLVFIYCLSGYVRLWGEEIRVRPALSLCSAAAISCMTVAVFFACCSIRHIPATIPSFSMYIRQNRIFVLAASCLYFMGFRQLSIRPVRWINSVSAATFGIYLIHDHETIRYLLWQRLLTPAAWQNSPYFIPFSVAVIFAVFTVCGIVEWVRIHTLEKLYMRPVERIAQRLQNKLYPPDSNLIQKNT